LVFNFYLEARRGQRVKTIAKGREIKKSKGLKARGNNWVSNLV